MGFSYDLKKEYPRPQDSEGERSIEDQDLGFLSIAQLTDSEGDTNQKELGENAGRRNQGAGRNYRDW